ncbi:MAG: glycosyltransferase [Alphaproteobacteria bacterium]
MHVTLVDDGIPFDGDSAAVRPLGGAEKAFAGLAGALAGLGHRVTVFNRAERPIEIGGAVWAGWDGSRPRESDVLIAYRKPSLLGFVPARRRLLWLVGPAEYLSKADNRTLLLGHQPILVFQARGQRDGWEDGTRLRAVVVRPGVGAAFLGEEPSVPADPPRAIVTTHPLHGLEWLLGVWRDKIRPVLPRAELHVYSAALDRAHRGEVVAQEYQRMLALARAAGAIVERPLPDPEMARAYRSARVHLYPSRGDEAFCGSLAESQASGVPAVARPLGAAADQVIEDVTGYLRDDDDAFANAALRVIGDDATFERMSRQARLQRRGWREAAAEFEALWA